MASILILVIPLLSCSIKPHPSLNSNGAARSVTKPEDILENINHYRQQKGLAVLQLNAVISEQAKNHSLDMAAKKIAFGHDGFEDRVKLISRQLGSLHLSAENVAYGKLTANEVVDVWLKSPGHRRNIEGKYTITGIGVAEASDGTIFFTQIFAAK